MVTEDMYLDACKKSTLIAFYIRIDIDTNIFICLFVCLYMLLLFIPIVD